MVVEPHAEAGAHDRPGAGKAVGRAARQQHAPRRVVERAGFEQRLDGVPLRRRLGGTDEQAAVEPSGDERRGAVDAAPVVAQFGELGLVAEHLARTLAPGCGAVVARQQQADGLRQRDARPPGARRVTQVGGA